MHETIVLIPAAVPSRRAADNPAAIAALHGALEDGRPASETAPLQEQVDDLRRTFQSFEPIPAMKTALAHFTGRESGRTSDRRSCNWTGRRRPIF